MFNKTTTFAALVLTATPGLASAAEVAASSSPVETIVASVAAILVAATPGIVGLIKARTAKAEAEAAKVTAAAAETEAVEAKVEAKAAEEKAVEASIKAETSAKELEQEKRRTAAIEEAVAFYDSCNRGVVLFVDYGSDAPSPVPLLREMGWTVCSYTVKPEEGDLPNSPNFWEDLGVADVVVLHGQQADGNERLANSRKFQEARAHGGAVLSSVPKHGVWYNQNAWGRTYFQSVTTPTTIVTAAMTAVTRRRVMQRLLGVKAGGLAKARAELVGEA